MRIVDASLGFNVAWWQVKTPTGETVLVRAPNNYAAAEACGFSFARCEVSERTNAGAA